MKARLVGGEVEGLVGVGRLRLVAMCNTGGEVWVVTEAVRGWRGDVGMCTAAAGECLTGEEGLVDVLAS